ncbi:MAG: glycosyltransferase family 4 protein [Chloroflexi bacterium]|nr:glycosyltransferase family 4 protein [Chloroflexota bacterium]
MQHIAINAHLLAPGNGYRRAGIHRYIYEVVSHLPGVDPDLRYTVLMNHQLEPALPRMATRVGPNTQRPWRRVLWEQGAQPLALQRLRPSLYHAMAFVSPRGLRCPSVVTVYDLSFIRYPEVLSPLRRRYLQMFTRNSCQRATRIIAISESTARDLTDFWGIPADKIDVSSVGVTADFKPLPEAEVAAFRQTKGLPERFLLFLGTLEPRKNLPMLLRAYASLPESVRQAVHLILAGGKGWMFDEIFATISRHNLGETVHTPGYVPAEELVLWYNAAEALVYPTLYEGFGIPILEAMACGKPVLASNSSSLPEATGDAGILLPSSDEAAWHEAMDRLISSPDERTRMAARSRTWAAEFTWQRVARRTVESYYRALS